MFRLAWRILRDLFFDGYSAVGAIAPLLSIGFTGAKALDLPIPNLHAISYAWGLLPLLIWVLVAYVRRSLRYVELEGKDSNSQTRRENLAKLGKLRARGVALRNKSVTTVQEMQQWNDDEKNWLDEVYKVAGELSQPLRDRIETLDTLTPGPRLDTPGFSSDHTHFRIIISEVTKRIGEYLESNQ